MIFKNSIHQLKIPSFFSKNSLLLVILAVIYSVIGALISIHRHNNFYTFAWDLGAYEQSLWTTLTQHKLLYNTPNFGHLQIHFEPILFLILPLYAIYPSPEILLVIQAVFLAMSVIPVYWIAKEEFQNERASTIFAVLYLLYPPLYSVQAFDFHAEAFMPFFLLMAFYYIIIRNKLRKGSIFLVLSLMCNEYVSIILIFFGLSMLLSNVRAFLKNRKIISYYLFVIILSLSWFFFSQAVMSYFTHESPQRTYGYEYIHLMWWGYLGNDFQTIIKNFLLNPSLWVEHSLNRFNEKLFYIIWLLGPFLFFSLRRMPILFPAIIWLGILFISDNYWFWQLGLFYQAITIPFIVVASIGGLKPFVRQNISGQWQKLFKVMTLATLLFLVHSISLSIPYIPTDNAHNEALREIIRLIPSSASVITQNNIFPHLTHIKQVYPGYLSGIEAEYVLVDMTSEWFGNVPGTAFYEPAGKALFKLYTEEGFRVVTAVDGILLLKKNYNGEFIIPVNSGLIAKFYDNVNMQGTPIFITIVLNVDWDRFTHWKDLSPFVTVPLNNYSAIYEGYLRIPKSSNYTFRIISSHGSRVYIDDKLIINRWGIKQQDDIFTIFLDKGFHKIRIEQLKLDGSGFIKLLWSTQNEPFKVIPPESFFIR
jgi:uncharacterized membrane protein